MNAFPKIGEDRFVELGTLLEAAAAGDELAGQALAAVGEREFNLFLRLRELRQRRVDVERAAASTAAVELEVRGQHRIAAALAGRGA